jgi:hypothetical protein
VKPDGVCRHCCVTFRYAVRVEWRIGTRGAASRDA